MSLYLLLKDRRSVKAGRVWRGEWSGALTCVRVPHGHQDADPAPQEEADFLCDQHLLDGRESL